MHKRGDAHARGPSPQGIHQGGGPSTARCHGLRLSRGGGIIHRQSHAAAALVQWKRQQQQAASSTQQASKPGAQRTTHLAGDAPAPGCPRCCNSPAPPPPCCCPPSSLRNSKAICLRLIVSLVIAAASHHRNHSLSPAAVAASIVAPPPKTFLFHPPSIHTHPPSGRHALFPLLSPFPKHRPLTARRHPRIRNHG